MAESGVDGALINNSIDIKGPGFNIVKTDPETGKVIAIAGTLKELNERLDRLKNTPASIDADGVQQVNPDWIAAKANALGLTVGEYSGLVKLGFEDIGSLVERLGIEKAKMLIVREENK